KGEEARRFSSYFIPTDTDGTDRPDGSNSAPDFTVNGRNTVQLTDFAPVGGVGMLELTGAPQLLITAKLVPIVEDGEKLGATLPVISSDNLLPANTLVQIQELERTDTRQTDFVLANLAQTAASCNVAAFRFDGSAIGSAGVVTLPPLSHKLYEDLLGGLGETQLAAARLTVSCNQTFYAYAVTFDKEMGEATVLNPSKGLDSSLSRPGDAPPPPPGCPASASQCFTRPGTFFTQVPPAIFHIEYFDVAPGTYSKVHFRVEVFHAGWGNLSGPGGLHSLFWLVVDRNFNLIGFSVFRKPPKSDVLFRHGIGIIATEKPKIFFPVEGIPGTTYVIDYTYNPAQRTLNYKLMDTAGHVLIDYNDVPNVRQLDVPNGSRLRADFGFNEGRNENEDPGYNWRYSNLTLEVFR
ncbi:MAG TPA: hypothetical protein PK413_10265, partial [Thermoanaerobaculia bacterium]|nr:hypothetical protein [Thermoanaerobaculia bacterium]